MKRSSLSALVFALVACAACQGPINNAVVQSLPKAKVHQSTTISNVYVLTEQTGCTGTGRCGQNRIVRYPALTNTSTANKTHNLSREPFLLRVSPYDGRVIVLFQNSQTVVVYNKDLQKLYDFTVPHTGAQQLPLAAAYDPSGDLYIAVDRFVSSSFTGKVYEFNASDTTPDNTYALHSDTAVYSIAISSGGEPYYEAPAGDDVYTCTVGPTYSCFDTSIPSNSICFSSGCPVYLAQIALTDTTHLNEMYSSTSSGDGSFYIKRYSAPSGTHSAWSYNSVDTHCNVSPETGIVDYTTDANATEYYTCYGYGYGLANGTVVENPSGSLLHYAITGITNPIAAGGY